MQKDFLFKRYHFICQKWLATDKDDGMISRELPALESNAFRLATAREGTSGAPLDYGLEMKGKFNWINHRKTY